MSDCPPSRRAGNHGARRLVYSGASPPPGFNVRFRLLLAVCAVAVCSTAGAARTAQTAPAGTTDLDAFMARVLLRRDDNWKKLQQYVLDERETFQILGPGGAPIYGWRREYTWFPRDGLFIRSPLRVDGV